MAGPIPVSFAVGCNILMALYFKVEGRMGVPALLEHEKALWGAERLESRAKVWSIALAGELRPKVDGMVFAELALNLGVGCDYRDAHDAA